MIGMTEQWLRNWSETFHAYRKNVSGGAVSYDRDALYGSNQRRSATVLRFSRTTSGSTAPTTPDQRGVEE